MGNTCLTTTLVTVTLLTIFVSFITACTVKEETDPIKEWWETAQFYQIYPRSFKDSNEDGIGDLNGITEKLEYLKDIGITAVWLSPIFESPMKDFGYDISDFYEIQPEYGRMDDFDNLIKKAKELGIKIILDFVPNHSSDQSEWFKKSVDRDPEYKDFYVWEDGIDDKENPGKKLPPSNWIAGFRGSAWQWNDKRKQFYLHQFAVQQPDLNYRNPKVIEKMNHVLRYWLKKGVDGFRCDAVPTIYEIERFENGTYLDEPESGLTDDPDDSAFLNHIYTQNQPETINLVYEWRKLMDEHQRIYNTDSKVLLIETYAPPNYTMQFYGNRSTLGAHIPFNFNLITQLNAKSTAKDIKNSVDSWLPYMPKTKTANWVIGNHDQKRASTRYGIEKIDHMNMLIMILPGVSVTYQGEELGMLDGVISWEDTVDPAGCNSNKDIYQKFSRDPARTPFQWDDSKNAGFSSADKTWLPMAPKYEELNVKTEKEAESSHLKIYKELIKLRSTKTLQFGDYTYDAINEDVFVVLRTYKDKHSVKMILLAENFSDKKQSVDLTKRFGELPKLKLVVKDLNSKKHVTESIDPKNLNLDEYEAIVLST